MAIPAIIRSVWLLALNHLQINHFNHKILERIATESLQDCIYAFHSSSNPYVLDQ